MRVPSKRSAGQTGDTGFRVATGAFALALVLIVAAIGFELLRQSMASVRAFGLDFWRTSTWDPIAGEFGADERTLRAKLRELLAGA